MTAEPLDDDYLMEFARTQQVGGDAPAAPGLGEVPSLPSQRARRRVLVHRHVHDLLVPVVVVGEVGMTHHVNSRAAATIRRHALDAADEHRLLSMVGLVAADGSIPPDDVRVYDVREIEAK